MTSYSVQYSLAGLGNTRGFYCNSNSGGSELQGIGEFLSPGEFYWKELIRSLKVKQELEKTYYWAVAIK